MAEFLLHKRGDQWQNVEKWGQHLASLPDGKYRVTIVSHNKRSNPQNRYYWGLVVPMLRDAFYNLGHDLTETETHEMLKAKFNSIEVGSRETGEVTEVPLSTTRLTKMAFCDYIEKIQRWSAQFLGVVIPDPGEQLTTFDNG